MIPSTRVIGRTCGRTLALVSICVHNLAAQAAPSPSASLPLESVLEQALRQHPLIEAARARVRERQGARQSAGAYANPTLSYWVENGRFPGRQLASPLDLESQVYATMSLEPLFQRGPRVLAADADVQLGREELRLAEQTVVLDATRAFFRVASAQVAVTTADDLQQQLSALVAYNQARVREGKTAEGDLIRTQVERDRVAASATLERVELARAWAGLSPYLESSGTATSAPRMQTVFIDGERAPATSVNNKTLDEYLRAARDTRPDVRAARARVESSRAQVSYQQRLSLRQLSATFGSKRTAGVTSMITGLSLPFPLFDRNRGEVTRATAALSAAEQELQWAERIAEADVRAAFDAASLLDQQASQLRDGFLTRAEESRRIALEAYQLGGVTLLQVLDASRTLGEARQMYYRIVFGQRVAEYELRAALGDSLAPASTSPNTGRALPPDGDRR